MIEIHLPFSPVPWSAPLIGRRRAYDKREPHKHFLRTYIKLQTDEKIEGYTALFFRFVFAPPKSTSKKNRALMLEGKILPTRCDCTNLQKLYEDVLKGIVIDDDRNVAQIYSEKVYGENEGIFIRIYTLQECALCSLFAKKWTEPTTSS